MQVYSIQRTRPILSWAPAGMVYDRVSDIVGLHIIYAAVHGLSIDRSAWLDVQIRANPDINLWGLFLDLSYTPMGVLGGIFQRGMNILGGNLLKFIV